MLVGAGASNISVIGNLIHDNGPGRGHRGLDFQGLGLVANNVAYGQARGDGIHIRGVKAGETAGTVIVTNNTATGNGGTGLAVQDTGSNVAVVNNVSAFNRTYGIRGYGCCPRHATSSTAYNNVLYRNRRAAAPSRARPESSTSGEATWLPTHASSTVPPSTSASRLAALRSTACSRHMHSGSTGTASCAQRRGGRRGRVRTAQRPLTACRGRDHVEGARAAVRDPFADPLGDRELVARFNERVAGGGLQYQFPLDARLPGEANGGEDLPVFRKLMIIEDGQEMRAGVLLHHSTIFVRGDERPFCWSLLPISEGAVQDGDPLAMLILMRRALEYQPFLTGLGVGSMDEDAAQYLVRLRWKNEPVPFVFYPVRPTRLLRGLRYLRRKPLLGLAPAVAAYSGAAAAFGWGWNRRRRRRAARVGFRFDTVPVFGEWADRCWNGTVRRTEQSSGEMRRR